MSFLAELWRFLAKRKKLWLMPIILISMFLGILLIVAKGSALAPFLYALF
jgi:hypothetical protein